MKYRFLALFGLLALGAGPLIQAQDYDDIYYDASKSSKVKVVSVEQPVKTIAVYGEVPEKYKVAVQSNYRVERDVDEYNRHGITQPEFEVDINGDTIYFNNDSIYYEEEAFANTRRIERFYNPDIVILSDDDDLVELYYDESPSINLIIGSDWSYYSYGWGYDSFYPWYTGLYRPWYSTWYDPWYYPYYGFYGWRWHGPTLWHWSYYHPWGYWGPHGWDTHWAWTSWDRPIHGGHHHAGYSGWRDRGGRVSPAGNRNGRVPVTMAGGGRNGISTKGASGNRGGSNVGTGRTGRNGYAGNRRGGNMSDRSSGGVGGSGVTTRSNGVTTRGTTSTYGGSRSSGYSGGSRSSGYSGGRSYSGGSSGSRSYSSGSSSSYGGSRSSSGGSYSSGSSSRSGGSSGGGSHGGSSGGGGRRR
ncbi:MAG: hypothetical protein SPL96_10745 [Bacteroidales bacterium]|nr:hypothetical protein [Bacteroidales bacterium]